MTDATPPDGPEPPKRDGEPDPQEQPGLARRYRSLPTWAQIAIPLVVVAIIVGGGLLISNATKSTTSSSATDVAPGTTTTVASGHDAIRGIAVYGLITQVAGPDTTTTTEPALTTTSDTPVSPSTEPATTEPATTEPATTEPATTTSAPATTVKPSDTTQAPTSPTSVVLPSGQLADSASTFAAAWNKAVTGTEVPPMSLGPTPNWTQETISGVSVYRANLGGNVWLAVLGAAPTSPIVQALLVWGPNVDSGQLTSQNALYRDAFQALMKTIDPSVTEAQRLKVTGALGLTDKHPPYPDNSMTSAEQPPALYDLFNANPADPSQPGPATVISATSSTAG